MKPKTLESKPEMHRTSVYYPIVLHDRVVALANKADITVNQALAQLIELGVEHVENNK